MMRHVTTLLSIALFITGSAMAKGTQDIAKTPHNLSTSAPVGNPIASTNEDEICIFCHTPHGGDLNGQLWNRDMSGFTGKTYTHYNSANLVAAGLSSSRSVSRESLLCLSCHDGSVALNQIMNTSNGTGGLPTDSVLGTVDSPINAGFGTTGPKIGDALDPATGDLKNVTNDLSDDHPISFSYTAVRGATAKLTAELKDPSIIEGMAEGPRFFGADKRVECSSCHDPHVDYLTDTDYNPFLIMPNDGSRLCLSCHIK